MTTLEPPSERRVAGGLPRIEVAWPDAAVLAGITTREHDFGWRTDSPVRAVAEARSALEGWTRGRFHGIVGASQVHGARIFPADGVAVPEGDGAGPWNLRVAGYDGLVTTTRGMLLVVTVADCVPGVLFAPSVGAVALVHAGWRGVAAEIVPRAVEALAGDHGAERSKVRAWWGPAIGPCCYVVGAEVVAAIAATSAGPPEGWRTGTEPRPRVDLRAALTLQAVGAGLDPGRVAASSRCTACEAGLFHSYRRARNGGGRMLAFAGLPLA